MVNLFIITTFLLITGGKTAPHHDLGAIVKQLELKVDQALRDLNTELVHTKKRIYDLEEQLKTYASSKQDHLPKSEKELERRFSILPARSTSLGCLTLILNLLPKSSSFIYVCYEFLKTVWYDFYQKCILELIRVNCTDTACAKVMMISNNHCIYNTNVRSYMYLYPFIYVCF